jgi:hypothetical protein
LYQLLEDVLPWLLGFYVLDSVAFSAAGETLFARRSREFVAARGPCLAGLLPWSEVVSGLSWPVRFSSVALFWPGPDGLVAVPWGELGPVERSERTVSAAGHSLRLPAPEDARRLATLLARLRNTPAKGRAQELRAAFEETSDVLAVLRLRERAGRHASWLNALGGILLAGLFGFIPLGLGQRLAQVPDPALVLLALVPVYAAILALSWRILRSCGLTGSAAFGALSNAFFLPVAAAHVQSFLTRRLYAGFDPLAIAAAVLPPAAFRRLARERYHRIRHEAAMRADLAEHAHLAEAAWRRIVARSGQTTEDVLGAPTASDPSAASYCPHCSSEYRLIYSACSDCRVALLPLAAA